MINTVVATTCVFKISSFRAITIRGAILSCALFIMALLGAPSPALAATVGSSPSSAATKAAKGAAKETLLKLPLRFEGSANGMAMDVHVGDRRLVLGKAGSLQLEGVTGPALTIKLEGANAQSFPVGQDRLPGNSNYFLGNDRPKWRKGVEQFAQARVKNVYDGIDLLYYGTGSELEHDYILTPGSDASAIQMRLIGGSTAIDAKTGDLLVSHIGPNEGSMRLLRPVAYQQTADGTRRPIKAEYARNENGIFGFQLGAYDHALPLTIDPVLTYSTYFGGSNSDSVNDVKTDAAGNMYLLMQAESTNLPVVSQVPKACVGTCGPANPSGTVAYTKSFDFFLAKLDPTGQTLLYSTYIGGSNQDLPASFVIAADGTIYIAGETLSSDFPVVNQYSANLPESGDPAMTLTRLSADGSSILYSSMIGNGFVSYDLIQGTDSYLGGQPDSVAAGPDGIAYLLGFAGVDGSGSFPDAKNTSYTQGAGGFVAKFDTTKSGYDSLLYATTLGQPGDRTANTLAAIAIDSKEDVWIFGKGYSNSPVTPDAVQPICGGGGQCNNTHLTALDPTGALLYATFLGGTMNGVGGPGIEQPQSIFIDPKDNIYLAGSTESVDFPLKNAPYTDYHAAYFLTKLSPGGKSLLYSTYAYVAPAWVTANTSGLAALAANGTAGMPQTNSLTSSAAAPYYSAGFEVFDTTKSGSDSVLISSYLGGTQLSVGEGSAFDPQGNLLFVGKTGDPNLPLVKPYQSTCNNCGYPQYATQGFAAKIQLAVGSLTLTPATQSFPDTPSGSSSPIKTSTLNNTTSAAITLSAGTLSDAADFTASDNCNGAIASGASCTITFTFTPQSKGTLSSTYSISDVNNPSSPLSVVLSGTGLVLVPAATLTPASYNFGNVTVGSQARKLFTFTNTGSTIIQLTGLPVSGNGFNYAYTDGNCGKLNPGDSCLLDVSFIPTSDGASNGSVQIQTASGITYTSTLTGTGVGAATLIPASYNFGNVTIGETVETVFTFTNTFFNSVTIGPYGTSGNGFAVENGSTCESTLNPGASCTIRVSFTPASDGAAAGSVHFQAGGFTYTSSLTGTGVGSATLNPASHNFGNVTVGASAQTAFTWTNTGSNSTTPGVPTTSGAAFTILYPSDCGSPVNPGASCTIQVLFTPTSDGATTGSVQLQNNGITYRSTLTGTGVGSATLNPATHDFGNVTVGAYSGTEFTFTNTRSQYAYAVGPLSVSGSAFQLETGSGCDAPDGVLLPGQSCTIYVLFSPASGGTATGSVQLQLNGVTYKSALTGTGVGIATTTSLVANPDTNLVFGRPITLTSTVAAASGTAIPTGTITFEVTKGVGVTVPLDKTGKAVYSGVVPPPGTYSVLAHYNGAAGFAGSSSATMTATVTAP